MSLPREPGHDDQLLVRYLLGLLPDEGAERLDEASIVDDELAVRLRIVEHELVDDYVRGALDRETLERFESHYLCSGRRRENVRFATCFLRAVDRASARRGAATEGGSTPVSTSERDGDATSRPASEGPTSRLTLVSSLAAALLLVACGTLLFEAVRLGNGLDVAKRESVALDRRARDLEQQLNEQRAVNATVVTDLERLRASAAALARSAAAPSDRSPTRDVVTTPFLVLLPQTRGSVAIPALTIPPGTDRVAFELRLESNDFPRYQVGLKDPATNRIVWRSRPIVPTSSGGQSSVSVLVPAGLFKPQHYSLDLFGRTAARGPDVVGSYAVRILLR